MKFIKYFKNITPTNTKYTKSTTLNFIITLIRATNNGMNNKIKAEHSVNFRSIFKFPFCYFYNTTNITYKLI